MKVNKMPSSKPLISCQLTVHILFLLILQFLWSADGAVYKLDPENPQGLLVQNAKKSVAYIFVPPHTSQSTGLAVQSLKLEAQLRWAKIPYHKISNQFFLGSPTDGSTPFMQYNGQYFEGANNIYRHLKEEWAPKVPSEEEVGEGEISAADGSQKRMPAALEVEMVQKPKAAPESDWKSTLSNMGAGFFKSKTAIDNKPKFIKKSHILESAKVLSNILIADRIFRENVNNPNIGGLAYMYGDEGLKQQIAPILFALEEEKASREGGGSTSTGALLVDGEKDDRKKQQNESGDGNGGGGEIVEDEEEKKMKSAAVMKRSLAMAKGKMPAVEEIPLPRRLNENGSAEIEVMENGKMPLAKEVPLRSLGRAFVKEYFALKNVKPEDEWMRASFLMRHKTLLAEHFDISDSESINGPHEIVFKKQLLNWHNFEKWLQAKLQSYLPKFFTRYDHGVLRSWFNLLTKSWVNVHELGFIPNHKLYSKCSDKDLINIFNKEMKLVSEKLRKHFKEKKSRFLFGQEPVEEDALLFAVLLQYIRLGEHMLIMGNYEQKIKSQLNLDPLKKYFAIIKRKTNQKTDHHYHYSESVKLMRKYVSNMLRTLEMDKSLIWKKMPSPWKLNEPKRLMEWKANAFYGEKYNGPFIVAKTDDLYWLLDFDLVNIDSNENKQLFIKNGANENADLMTLVLKELVGYMRTSKFKWDDDAVGKYGSDLLHLVAAYLCNMGGQEVPRGVLEGPETITEEAKRCSQIHFIRMTDWRMQLGGFVTPEFKEWTEGVRATIYEAVVEFNEGLVEERVEQAILEAAKEGRRADPGLGIEMF